MKKALSPMVSSEALRNQTVKALARLAKTNGIPGWHAMRKDELVKALLARANKPRNDKQTKAVPTAEKKGSPVSKGGPLSKETAPLNDRAAIKMRPLGVNRGTAPAVRATEAARRVRPSETESADAAKKTERPLSRPSRVDALPSSAGERELPPRERSNQRAREALLKRAVLKDLSAKSESSSAGREVRDKLLVMVRDPYWLHVHWELSRLTVERARAALGPEWHAARPVLRVYRVCEEGLTGQAEMHECDVEIHGGVADWYIDVPHPPCTYRVDIGYLTATHRLHVLARGNLVTTPAAGEGGSVDRHWDEIAEDFDRVFAMSGGFTQEGASEELREALQERLRRPVHARMATHFRGPAEIVEGRSTFLFQVDAEIIIHGTARPDTYIKVDGEPVRLRSDGTFTMRLHLPDKRQVIPIVAQSADGIEQRTAVLAFERNTKYMEPVIREPDDE